MNEELRNTGTLPPLEIMELLPPEACEPIICRTAIFAETTEATSDWYVDSLAEGAD